MKNSHLTSKVNDRRSLLLLSLIVLFLVHFFIRWIMARSPLLAEVFYDEAVTGEMGLHILKGEPLLFFWGQPYMGALEAYLASFLFHLFGPTTFILRLTDILICAFMLFLVNRLGALVGGWAVGLLAAIFWAVSPLYLSEVGLLATGGHVEACAAGTFVIFGICWLVFKSPKDASLLACLIGLVAGLGWWSSLLAVPFLVAGVFGLIFARPRLLLSRVPWMGIFGFLLGSLPFWLWQYYHGFSTFQFFEGDAGGGLKQLWPNLYISLRFSFFQTLLGDWWDGHSVLPSIPSFLAWAVLVVIYLPAFILSLIVIIGWFRRITTLKSPFQEPIDLLVLTFWILIFSFSASERGAVGSLRYSLALYPPFAVILAVWLNKIFHFRRSIGSFILVGLLVFNLFLHYLYLEEFKNVPYRQTDNLIKALKDRGIRYAYADNRVSQVLTFESQGKIICADYFGRRNYNYLRAVDAAPAEQVAIVTHQILGGPYPEAMAASLRFLGGKAEQGKVGPFVFWDKFKEPVLNHRPLSSKDWRITSNREANQVNLIKDRDILTAWEVTKEAGDWVAVDLGRSRLLSRISILPGPVGLTYPSGLKVELSLDGKAWETLVQIQPNDLLTGLHWYHGRPRLDFYPRIQVSFSPHLARHIRITNLSKSELNPNENWSIAELFIYEAADTTVEVAPSAQAAYHQALQALDHFMDDPTGPHFLFPGASPEMRRERVDWDTVLLSLQKAVREAPDWEEPFQLLSDSVDLGGWWNPNEKPKELLKNQYSQFFPDKGLVPIPSRGWKISSNINQEAAGLAIDGNPETRWGSSRGQEPGDYIQLDLGSSYNINGLALFLGRSINDYPRLLKIMASTDGTSWREIKDHPYSDCVLFHNRLMKKGYYLFEPLRARYLKLIQMGKNPIFWWSIYELEVYEGKD